MITFLSLQEERRGNLFAMLIRYTYDEVATLSLAMTNFINALQ
jgi:hypothetical protein